MIVIGENESEREDDENECYESFDENSKEEVHKYSSSSQKKM